MGAKVCASCFLLTRLLDVLNIDLSCLWGDDGLLTFMTVAADELVKSGVYALFLSYKR